MKKFGVFKGMELMERFENKEQAKARVMELLNNTKEVYVHKEIPFNLFDDEEKMIYLEEKLEKHKQFIDGIAGLGRTYHGDLVMKVDELSWLIEKAKLIKA